MCVWPRWTEKIKTAWSLFISHAWLTPPRRFTKIIISILTPLLKAAGARTDSRIHQSVLLVCQRLFVHGWLGKKEKKFLLFFVSTCLREPTRLNFVRYGRGVTSQGKIPFWCCVLEAKIIIMGLVTNYILKMSGLPALEEVCYDHTMQL